jgi:outer membrane protein insertion porin family
MRYLLNNLLFALILCIATNNVIGQIIDSPATEKPKSFIDYSSPKKYELANIVITGTNFYDKSVLMVLSGLTIGQSIKIPSEDITKAVNNLYKQKLFDDVSVRIMDIQDDKLTLEIYLREKPRLSTLTIKGLSKGKANTLREELTIKSAQIITDNLLTSTRNEIKRFYAEKGFLDADAKITQEPDDAKKNTAKLKIEVNLGNKIKINDIVIEGNEALPDNKVRKLFKDTKPKRRLFAKSRYEEDKYTDDKQRIIEKYLTMGYRDITIVTDSIYRYDKKSLQIVIKLEEGKKYHFRDIKFIGNTKYTTKAV